jgi:hypothetical protein
VDAWAAWKSLEEGKTPLKRIIADMSRAVNTLRYLNFFKELPSLNSVKMLRPEYKSVYGIILYGARIKL